MTLNEFFQKYNGRKVDFDGAYGAQCMDLMHQYVLDVYGLPGSVLRAPTAYQAYVNGHEEFHKIEYKKGVLFEAGDIIFWSDKYVKNTGHVAIVLSASVNGFTSFDQNWPVGSSSHQVNHSFDGVVGVLRHKSNKKEVKRMKISEKQRCVWIKASGEDTAEYWVLTRKDDGSEVRHKVKSDKASVAMLFGMNERLERVEWPHIAGLKEGKPYDLNNVALTHPEYFELQ